MRRNDAALSLSTSGGGVGGPVANSAHGVVGANGGGAGAAASASSSGGPAHLSTCFYGRDGLIVEVLKNDLIETVIVFRE